MVIYEKGKKLPKNAPLPGRDDLAAYFVSTAELPKAMEILGLAHILPASANESASNRFESHKLYECLLLNIPDASVDVEAEPTSVDIYYTATKIVFIHDSFPVIDKLENSLSSGDIAHPGENEHILYAFLNLLTENDAAQLEDIEEEIAQLEDMIADEKQEDYISKISELRSRLLKRKRYYESLYEAMAELEENQNEWLNEGQLHLFHLITNRADRLLRSVLNLRDYVTQVRESYQSQLDISLNQTMKLFTVVTTIFLPLSLIAGWYGMNLHMPEVGFPYLYPIIIGLSVAIVAGCLLYFKKKGWF